MAGNVTFYNMHFCRPLVFEGKCSFVQIFMSYIEQVDFVHNKDNKRTSLRDSWTGKGKRLRHSKSPRRDRKGFMRYYRLEKSKTCIDKMRFLSYSVILMIGDINIVCIGSPYI